MKLDDIDDPKMRKQVAELQIAYWDECKREAARLHPNWTITSEGRFRHNGSRTSPRTPHTLLNWFLANHGDRADQIRDRTVAMLRFSGQVTAKRNARH